MPVEQAEGQRKVRPAKARLRFAYDKTGGKGGAVGPGRYEAVSFGPTFEVRPHDTQQLGKPSSAFFSSAFTTYQEFMTATIEQATG